MYLEEKKHPYFIFMNASISVGNVLPHPKLEVLSSENIQLMFFLAKCN